MSHHLRRPIQFRTDCRRIPMRPIFSFCPSPLTTNSPTVATTLKNLVALYRKIGKMDAAEVLEDLTAARINKEVRATKTASLISLNMMSLTPLFSSTHSTLFQTLQQNHEASGRPGKFSYLASSESLASSSSLRDKHRSFFKDNSRRGSRESLESTGEVASAHVSHSHTQSVLFVRQE